jgi:hypothetical protein
MDGHGYTIRTRASRNVLADVIALATGILLDSSNGQGSNREIFITHATMDSDGIGLYALVVLTFLLRLLEVYWTESADTSRITVTSALRAAGLHQVTTTTF